MTLKCHGIFEEDPFIQNRKFMSFKFTKDLCVMTMKDDAKFEKKLT